MLKACKKWANQHLCDKHKHRDTFELSCALLWSSIPQCDISKKQRQGSYGHKESLFDLKAVGWQDITHCFTITPATATEVARDHFPVVSSGRTSPLFVWQNQTNAAVFPDVSCFDSSCLCTHDRKKKKEKRVIKSTRRLIMDIYFL